MPNDENVLTDEGQNTRQNVIYRRPCRRGAE